MRLTVTKAERSAATVAPLSIRSSGVVKRVVGVPCSTLSLCRAGLNRQPQRGFGGEFSNGRPAADGRRRRLVSMDGCTSNLVLGGVGQLAGVLTVLRGLPSGGLGG